MKIGDKLLEINGEPVKQLTHKEALMIIDLGVLILCTSVYMYEGPFSCLLFSEPSSVVLLLQRVKPTPVPSGRVVYSGWLTKRGGTGMTPRNWRRRWFVVRDDCIAYYYSSSEVSVRVVYLYTQEMTAYIECLCSL